MPKRNYDSAMAELHSLLEIAFRDFRKHTGMIVTNIKVEDGIIYDVQSSEYFEKRMARLRKRRSKKASVEQPHA